MFLKDVVQQGRARGVVSFVEQLRNQLLFHPHTAAGGSKHEKFDHVDCLPQVNLVRLTRFGRLCPIGTHKGDEEHP